MVMCFKILPNLNVTAPDVAVTALKAHWNSFCCKIVLTVVVASLVPAACTILPVTDFCCKTSFAAYTGVPVSSVVSKTLFKRLLYRQFDVDSLPRVGSLNFESNVLFIKRRRKLAVGPTIK